MTLRAAGLLVGGAGLAVWGWFTGWPELTALGAAAVTLVVLVLLVAGPTPRVQVALDQAALRVVRGQEATVRMRLHLPLRRRWLRIVEGSRLGEYRTRHRLRTVVVAVIVQRSAERGTHSCREKR